MKIIKTDIEGILVFEPDVHGDERGYFYESFRKTWFEENGITHDFLQDNNSKSVKGVLRGLHFQKEPHAQAKLVRVTRGEVYDVAVDIREGSPTYGKYFGITLSAENKKIMYIPKGFAHGFLVLSEEAEFSYKCSDYYDQASEGGIIYNDPTINIDWPKLDIPYNLSEKDQKYPTL